MYGFHSNLAASGFQLRISMNIRVFIPMLHMYICTYIATPSFVGFLHHIFGLEMEMSTTGNGSGKKSGHKGKG